MQITLKKDLAMINQEKPLILNLTNLVTINDLANIEIAIGASPVMSDCLNDALTLGNYARAILINIGTINKRQGEIMLAVAQANFNKKPIMMDLVGYGATASRNKWVEKLIPFVSAIKGNYAEILSFNKKHNLTKGVDGDIEISDPVKVVSQVAKESQKLVLMTGAVDHISDGKTTLSLKNGDPLLKTFTGSGCMLGAVSVVFLAINNSLSGLVNAASLVGLSAQEAAVKERFPQAFKRAWLDKIYDALNWIDESKINITINSEK